MNYLKLAFLACMLYLTTSCSIQKHKDLVYDKENQVKMDVFSPKKATNAPMLVFIHGGNWNSGKKSTYAFFGKQMAKHGVITAVIDYRMGPGVNIQQMAMDVARSVEWFKENGATYGGDKSRLFISGHSAGGQLAALVALNDEYFKKLKVDNPIKGAILIDAFGLDMYDYLSLKSYASDSIYYSTFTTNPENWKAGSPIHYIHKNMPPLQIFVGGKTWPAISRDNFNFWSKAKEFQQDLRFNTVKRKAHVRMILQFANPWNRNIDKVLKFIEDPKTPEPLEINM